MKIYFAVSIRGGREDVDLYEKIVYHLRTHGKVLSEHVGDKNSPSWARTARMTSRFMTGIWHGS